MAIDPIDFLLAYVAERLLDLGASRFLRWRQGKKTADALRLHLLRLVDDGDVSQTASLLAQLLVELNQGTDSSLHSSDALKLPVNRPPLVPNLLRSLANQSTRFRPSDWNQHWNQLKARMPLFVAVGNLEATTKLKPMSHEYDLYAYHDGLWQPIKGSVLSELRSRRFPAAQLREKFTIRSLNEFASPVETSDGIQCQQAEIQLDLSIADANKFLKHWLVGTLLITSDDVDSYFREEITAAVCSVIQQTRFAELEPNNESARTKMELSLLEVIQSQNCGLDARISGLKLDWNRQSLYERTWNQRRGLVNSALHAPWINPAPATTNDAIIWRANLASGVRGRLIWVNNELIACTTNGCVDAIMPTGSTRHVAIVDAEILALRPNRRPQIFEAGPAVIGPALVVVSRFGHVWRIPLAVQEQNITLSRENCLECYPDADFRSNPLSSAGPSIYFAATRGARGPHVLRVDAQQPQWLNSDTDPATRDPFAGSTNVIYFCSFNGRILRLDPRRNTLTSLFDLELSCVHGGMALSGDSVGFVAHEHGLLAFSVATMSKIRNLEAPDRGTLGFVTPTIAGDAAYAGSLNGYLLGLKSDGRPVWTDSWLIDANARFKCQAAAWRGFLFIASQAGRLYALDLERQKVLWTFETGAAVYAPIWVDKSTGVVVVANDAGVVTAIPWYHDRWQTAIEYYKQWREFDTAALLAFLHRQFDDAKRLWDQSSSTLGKALVTESEGDFSRAHQHYSQFSAETNVPVLKLEIERVIESLQTAAGGKEFRAQPGTSPDSDHSASRPRSIWDIEQIHTPNIVLRTPGELYVKVQPRHGYETVAIIQARMDLSGDVQTPILDKEISAEILRVLQQKGYFFVCLNITPSQLPKSSLDLKMRYQSSDGAHYQTSQSLTVSVSAEPQPTYHFHAPTNIVSGDGVIIVRGLGTDKTQTRQIIINEQQVELFRKSGKLDRASG